MVDRWEGRKEGHSEAQKADRMEGLMVDRWEDRKGGHSEAQKADRMEVPREAHLEDRMGGHSGGQKVDRMEVWGLPWAGQAGGMMLVVPGWFLSLPTPASAA